MKFNFWAVYVLKVYVNEESSCNWLHIVVTLIKLFCIAFSWYVYSQEKKISKEVDFKRQLQELKQSLDALGVLEEEIIN